MEEERGGSFFNTTEEEQKKYIEDLMSFLPLAFCFVDSSDRVQDNNKAFEYLTGYEKRDIVERDVKFFFENKGKMEGLSIKVATRRGVVEEEMILINREGRRVSVLVSALSRRDENNNFKGYFLTINDITELKMFEGELEKKIRERTEELEQAKEKLEESEAVLEVKIRARTQELEELTERLEEKVRERTREIEEKALDLERSTLEMKETQVALLNLAEDTNNASKEAEREKEKTMAIIRGLVDGLFLFDIEKKLVLINPKAEEMFGVKKEDVEEKEIEELKDHPALEKLIEIVEKDNGEPSRNDLEQENGTYLEITTALIKQEEKIIGTLVNVHDITREKSIEKIKTEFVSVAAHQLRTPLAGIKWTLQTIIEEAAEAGIPEEIVDFIQKAYEANDRMVHLVNDLLNVSRIEEGRYVYEPEEVEFMDVINPVIEAYREHIKNRNLEFEVVMLSKNLPMVKVDKEKIGIVMQNFLDNAMKYTNEGKVTLTIEHIDGKIKTSVSDTGVGIPEDQQKRLFNKFFRAANVQRMDTEGSGLGLFITKNIVEAHGGSVGFYSKAGEGSTFYFTLPANKEEIDSFFRAF